MHYKRLTRSGVVGGAELQERQANNGRPCASPQCDRPAITKGYCEAHYQRLLRGNGDTETPIRDKRKPGTGGRWIDNHGYVTLTLPGDGRRVSEHRYVMEQEIGRPLRSDESVHHINGVRSDNRPENLELWGRFQPAGQKVADLLDWANEIIARYGG